jgi:hypothetical protein
MVWAVVWAPAPDQTRPFAAAGKKNLGDRTVKVKARRTSAVICALPLRWWLYCGGYKILSTAGFT